MTPEEFFADSALGRGVLARVTAAVDAAGGAQVRVSRSQVAFRRRRGFAYLWRPGRYLRRPAAEVVLSIALGRRDGSARWKEVVHPSPTTWMHHLEVHDPSDIDDAVAAWLHEAADDAGPAVRHPPCRPA